MRHPPLAAAGGILTMDYLALITLFAGTVRVTLKIFFLTILFSVPLGFVVAAGRMSKHAVIRVPVQIYQLLMRGTPLILQLIVVYFSPYYIIGFSFDRFTATIVAFVINYAAYFAEIYRGGIESMPHGQYEAAKVLGLSKLQTFFQIILPQVIKRILPSMGNEFMTLIKDTALAQTIGVAELFRSALTMQTSLASTTPLFIAGIFYLLMNTVVEWGFKKAEQGLDYYK